MKPVEIFGLKPSPRVLIEASAGTGKTFNIAGLFVRFIAEGKVQVDELLVVTFTKAATKELKARIYQRLRDCRELLSHQGREVTDKFETEFLKNFKSVPEALPRIQKAISNFDDVTISTIHGFCQSVLNEYILISGIPADWNIEETNILLEETVQDYWRSFMSENRNTTYGKLFFELFTGIAETPEKLLSFAESVISKPYSKIEPERGSLPDPLPVFEKFISLKKEIKQIWNHEKESISVELTESNLKGFTQRNLDKWSSEMDKLAEANSFNSVNFTYLEKFSKSYHDDPGNYKKAGRKKILNRDFYTLCDELLELSESFGNIKTAFLLDILETLQKNYEKKRKTGSSVTYDDLLNRMAEILKGINGVYFAEKLRKKFPIALVDEFQDTDPVQYKIFSLIYPKNDHSASLIMIGDPKQAIYEFRGADVFAYMQARNEAAADSRFTLNNNYRSNPMVIESVNKLFSKKKDAFIIDEFDFYPAGYGNISKYLIEDEQKVAPMHFIINRENESEYQNKQQLRKKIYRDVAMRIAGLIKKGIDKLLMINDKLLSAGDIAVLVNSHKEGESIQEELLKLNIKSVKISRQNVFNTPEAYRIQLLLESATDAGSSRSVRKLMMSGFRGLNLSVFPSDDQDEYNVLLEELHLFRQKFAYEGFYPAFRWLLFEKNGLSFISELEHTDRVISNIFQIADLCSKAEQELSLQLEGLLSWLTQKRKEEQTKRDEDQLRLENDSELVKITTVHNSKGLSFPIVFSPFLWNTTLKSDLPVTYHRKENGNYNQILDFSFSDSEQKDIARREELIEKTAEEVRKAYVAITRGRYVNYVYLGVSQDTCFSGLGAILSGRNKLLPYFDSGSNLKREEGTLNATYYSSQLEELAAENPGLFSVSELNDQSLADIKLGPDENGKVHPVKFHAFHRLNPSKSLFSFSSLMVSDSGSVYQPDYDEWTTGIIQETKTPDAHKYSLFDFPRGASAGTIIHKVFESQIFGEQNTAGLTVEIEKNLEQNRLDQKWTESLLKMVRDVSYSDLHAEAGEVVRLNKLGPEDQLSEMEFQLKSDEPAQHEVESLIRKGVAAKVTNRSATRSFMKGFIDLVVWQNKKAYIIDYKSNYLGDQIDDYNKTELSEEIREKSYDIQYHFYTLALSRYLENRIEYYDYDAHFGGVFYLFVRGIKPGNETGIYFHKPKKEIVTLLDQMLVNSAG